MSFLFAPCGGCRSLPRSAERNSPLKFSEKPSARQGRTRLRQFVYPGQPVQKKSRPERMNRLAVRVPCSACAEKNDSVRLFSGKKRKAEENFCLLYKNILDIL